MPLGRVLGKGVLGPSSNDHRNAVGSIPTDLVAEHSARIPHEGARGTLPLDESFVEGRETSFGSPPHSGPLLTHIFWIDLPMAYIYFDHNVPRSCHLVMDTPALTPLCVLTLTNYATIRDVSKKTFQT